MNKLLLPALLLLVPLADAGARHHTGPDRNKSRVEVTGSGSTAVSPADSLVMWAGNIHQFNSLFPQEKVYLEFDNSAYFQGENIWFKAFVTHASTLERAPSKVLYVDLISPEGTVLETRKLKVVAGQADGVFPLIEASTGQARAQRGMMNYPSGFYEIRAYTQNQLDFTPDALFSRIIPVYTKPKHDGEFEKSKVVEIKKPELGIKREEADVQKRDIEVAFFPEGGDIVQGLPCNVAFKATGPDGLGLDGQLILTGGAETVETVHDGMGSVCFTPSQRSGLQAQFISADGEKRRVTLPRAVSSGYSMIVTQRTDSTLKATAYRTPDRRESELGVVVTCRGEVVHFSRIEAADSMDISLDAANWPLGVCRLTLYNRDGMVLSSRSLFHTNGSFTAPSIEISTDSLYGIPFMPEIINLHLSDRDGNPIRDRFCLSVRDVTDYGAGCTDNILSNLLLSSDLRGYIQDPAWYLESDDELHHRAMDLLTLVQGWERYEWHTMTGQNGWKEQHRVEDSLTMNGWIMSYMGYDKLPDITVMANLIPKDKTKFEEFQYTTDTTGYFGFDLADFEGNATFNISLMEWTKKGKPKYPTKTRIRFERADAPQTRAIDILEKDMAGLNSRRYDPNDEEKPKEDDPYRNIVNMDMGVILDDVDIEARRQFVDYDTFHAWNAYKDAEAELDKGEYTSDLYGWMLEKGYMFHERLYYYVHNSQKYVMDRKPFDMPESIDMADVISVNIYDEVMTPSHLYTLIPLEVEYHRKHMDTNWFVEMDNDWQKLYRLVDVLVKEEHQLVPGKDLRNLSRRKTTVAGYSETVEFFAPTYPNGPVPGETDFHRTLYWNPNVITDKDGNARVEFYNNGFSRHFTISGAGITASGTPYSLDIEF